MILLIGKVLISKKINKTAIVLVKKCFKNILYNKTYFKFKKYYAHDPFNLSNKDDIVYILKTKPFSKKKFWEIIKFL